MRNRLKDITYSRLIGSKKWKRLRLLYLQKHPLCEICLREGRTTIAQEVHHVKPVSSGRNEAEKRMLAYSTDNLQALCEKCHRKVHEEMQSWTRISKKRRNEKIMQFTEDFLREWVDGDGKENLSSGRGLFLISNEQGALPTNETTNTHGQFCGQIPQSK